MIDAKIGTAAGKIWEALSANGPVTQRKLRTMTGLPADLANQGIGWLAREGKLAVNGSPKGDFLLTVKR
jgi:predicted HTH transcriptional regulator